MTNEQQCEVTVTRKDGSVVQVYTVPASQVTRQHEIWARDMGTGRKRYQLAVRAA